MSEPRTVSPPAQVPRFVRRLNELASAQGMRVEVEAAALWDESPEVHLWSRWEGSKEQFLALDLLTPCQYRILERGGSLTIPGGVGGRTDLALLHGFLSVGGANVTWEIDFGPATYEIALRERVEVVTYADETLYHGTDDDLIAVGIEQARLPRGKPRGRSSSLCDIPMWRSRRQPDGTVVYRIESANKIARRLAEEREYFGSPLVGACKDPAPVPKASRPYLRLVVDNTHLLPGSEERLGPCR